MRSAAFPRDHDLHVIRCDASASLRLVAQHQLITARIGGLLAPELVELLPGEIRLKNRPGANSDPWTVADVSCGNGAWTLDVARQYGSKRVPDSCICGRCRASSKTSYQDVSKVVGLDMSGSQFPAPWDVPKPDGKMSKCAVSFETWDIFDPVPPHLIEQFDIVHARLLVGPISDAQKSRTLVLDRLFQILKPGGWVQWVDLTYPIVEDCNGCGHVESNKTYGEGVECMSLSYLADHWDILEKDRLDSPDDRVGKRKHDCSRLPAIATQLQRLYLHVPWFDKLVTLLKDRGITTIHHRKLLPAPGLRRMETQNLQMALHEVSQMVPVSDAFVEALRDMEAEIEQDGRLPYSALSMVVAQKPKTAEMLLREVSI